MPWLFPVQIGVNLGIVVDESLRFCILGMHGNDFMPDSGAEAKRIVPGNGAHDGGKFLRIALGLLGKRSAAQTQNNPCAGQYPSNSSFHRGYPFLVKRYTNCTN